MNKMKFLENYRIQKYADGSVELYDFAYDSDAKGGVRILSVFHHGRKGRGTEGISPDAFFASLGTAGREVKAHVLKVCKLQGDARP